jgi:hypothetical protein
LAGKWPFFLNPRQCVVTPISAKSADYCNSVYLYLHKLGYNVKLDVSNDTVNKKVRTHQLEQWNFILVAGEEEKIAGTVDVRSREGNRMGKMRVDKLHAYFQSLLPEKSNAHNKFYENAWDPASYEEEIIEHRAHYDKKEKIKLFAGSQYNSLTQLCRAVADISGCDMEVVIS